MGKIFNTADKNTETVKPSTFIDRTNENWYAKKNSNKIAFCKSIDDIIDGKAEMFEFTEKEMSVRIDKNSRNEDVERNNFIMFTFTNNTKVLVRSRDELK